MNYRHMIIAAGLAAIFAGCATPQKYEAHKQAFAVGLYADSIKPFEKDMEKRQKKAGKDADGNPAPIPGTRKYALDDMEMGAAFRAAGALDDSNIALDRAETGIREQQEASTIGGAMRQVAAVFANDNALPYQIQEYDGIMVNTYKALNLLEQGAVDDARVEFNRVAERQRMAAERFAKQIAKERDEDKVDPAADEEVADADASADEEAAEPKKKEGGLGAKVKALVAAKFNEAKSVVMGSMQDGENKAKLDEYQTTFAADTWGAQDAFTNPFATYMQGLFLLAYGEDKSDAESAVHALETACHTEKDSTKNPAAKALALATGVANGKIKKEDVANKVFVVFENGLCPEKQEYTIPIIIPLNMEMNSDAKFVDATLVLPKLVSRDPAYPFLSVAADGTELAKTVSVCNMDAVIASEYRERMPSILTRNIIQVGVKAVLQVLIINELGKQGVPRLAASVAVAAAFNLTKHADTRIWASLPKDFQIAVIERPASGKLDICAPNVDKPIATADIPAGAPAFVFVKVPTTGVTPKVSVVSATR